MEEELSQLERDHCLTVVLQGGLEKTTTVHGSTPVMDLLVTLCANYHLNPSDYTVEFLSPNKNTITFKPNSPIGSLGAEKIVLRPKAVEEKCSRPYMPEATVRLLVSYNKAHKTVVRVNPKLPLEMLLPLVCNKCEFNVETTVLLAEGRAKEPLDLTKTLNDLGLREVFAKDLAAPKCEELEPRTLEPVAPPTEVISSPPQKELQPKKNKNQKENSRFLGLFRRRKKKTEMTGVVGPPTSPGLQKHAKELDVPSASSLADDMRKKRPAPPPPMGQSMSVPSNLEICHRNGVQKSANCTLIRSTKRRAPPPPRGSSHPELQDDTAAEGTRRLMEDLKESDESDSLNLSCSSSSSPPPSISSSSSARQSLTHLPPFQSKDLTEAHHALAKVLTSEVSKGALVQRLRNSSVKCSSSPDTLKVRSSDDVVVRGEHEPILKSKQHSEAEWEEPAWRKSVNTFKVFPKTSHPKITEEACPEPCPSPPQQDLGHVPQGSPQVEVEDTEPSDSSDQSRRSSPIPVLDQFCSDDLKDQACPDVPSVEDVLDAGDEAQEVMSPGAGEEKTRIAEEDKVPFDVVREERDEPVLLVGEEDFFPPPPPPVFYSDDVLTDAAATPHISSVASTQTTNRLEKQETNSDGIPPEPLEKPFSAPTRFAQAVALAVQRSQQNSRAKVKHAEALASANGGLS
ncbi:cordon-bleu protein-like 1 isoform X1 [Synchiropus splendidus]|uniref:cordon-bleu protein-like 1 isoform X1 n=1 Tax=Synchiropus splendidus TaxID=270530 RepID=UPI00237EC635|nr:cordon-bleu protein-like 1 isoform X1 [Synchiropus splendidus]XP_053740842.1 cordon-bleu protein-like 1 isoform X1 [Synchiropus splendidus]XP_053740852.1 cordon-bleu protein-like 1 isoform X1 [Synchiropus splendidus]